MTNLEKIIRKNFYFDEEIYFSHTYFYEFIRRNPFISTYSFTNGSKYYFFAVSGRVYYVSEFFLSFLIFAIYYFGTVGLRKLFKKYQISKKIRKKLEEFIKKIQKKIQKTKEIQNRKVLSIRGGDYQNNILHYEVEPIQPNYVTVPDLFFQLNLDQLLTKAVLKKCLKQNRFYKVRHRGLLQIIEKMVGFKKKDDLRIISYDVFILALVHYVKPMSPFLYQGTI